MDSRILFLPKDQQEDQPVPRQTQGRTMEVVEVDLQHQLSRRRISSSSPRRRRFRHRSEVLRGRAGRTLILGSKLSLERAFIFREFEETRD